MEYKIIVAGIGPGHPDYILPAVQRAIAQASCLVGGQRALSTLAKSHQKCIPITKDLSALVTSLQVALKHTSPVVLVSGDPGFYSLLAFLRRHFSPQQLCVLPGISSLQFLFAKLALPWQNARFISLHGRQPQQEILRDKRHTLGILTDNFYNVQRITQLLIEAGWPADTTIVIASQLSYPDEKIITCSLQEALSLSPRKNSILVVLT